MNEQELKDLYKQLPTIHGIVSTSSRRRNMEMLYYSHHKDQGIQLRGKYRPQ